MERGSQVRKWGLRFSAIEFFYWACNAAVTYKAVFLSACGFGVAQVGVINSIVSGLCIISNPIGGALADKIQSSRKAFIAVLLMVGAFALIIPQTIGAMSLLAALYVAQLVLLGPTAGLLDITVINGCARTGSQYGSVRAFGSLGAIAMSLVLAAVISRETVYLIHYLYIVCALLCVYFLVRVKPVSDSYQLVRGKHEPLHLEKLIKNPYFIAFLLFSAVNNVPQICFYLYNPYLVEAAGGSIAMVGFIQAFRIVFELPALFAMSQLSRKVSYRNMVLSSTMLWGVMMLMCHGAKSMFMLVLVSALAGLSNGLFIAGSGKFNLSMVPPELQSTAQTLMYGCQALGGIIGSLVGGFLIEYMGIFNFFLVLGVLNVSVVFIYALSFSLIRAAVKKRYNEFF